MSFALWRSHCSTCLRLGHRPYALAALARQKSSPTHIAYAGSASLEISPEVLQQYEEVATPAVVSSSTIKRVGKLAKKLRRPKEEIPSHRNLLEQTKVQEYLDFVASTNDSVTLADIERCRPLEHGVPGTPKYESDYNSLLDTLVRSFSTKQLRQFLHLYQLEHPKKPTKWHSAASIIERQWGWPSLTEIQKQQRDWTEVTYGSFPLDPRQAFLILGKDGMDLFSLSLKHNVHVSFSVNPLALKAEGLRGSLDNLSQYINEFKSGIKQVSFQLPFKRTSKPALLESISRSTGVFTENVGHGTLRMSYKSGDVGAAHLARRLATRATFDELATEVPTLIYSPTGASSQTTPLTTMFPHHYSLYPFVSPRAFPRIGSGSSLFRLRRVGEWLRVDARGDGEQDADAVDRCSVAINLAGEKHNIRDVLLNRCPGDFHDVDGTKRVLTASFGHLLIPSPSLKRVTITSPLAGPLDLSSALEWVKGHGVKLQFTPSLPVPLLDIPPAEQRIIHRIMYRTLPAVVRGADPSPVPTALKFEIALGLSNTKPTSTGDVTQGVEASQQNPSVTGTIDLSPKCWVGPETRLNLMIPDRSMDIRFTRFDCLSLAQDEWPQDLQNYFRDLRSFLSGEETTQPDAPLILEYQDATYVLQFSSSIRQSSEVVSPAVSGLATHFRTISESSLDLESSQKSTSCQVLCEDATSDIAWQSFFRNCERLTALRQDRRLEA